jgi:hypothetical protein
MNDENSVIIVISFGAAANAHVLSTFPDDFLRVWMLPKIERGSDVEITEKIILERVRWLVGLDTIVEENVQIISCLDTTFCLVSIDMDEFLEAGARLPKNQPYEFFSRSDIGRRPYFERDQRFLMEYFFPKPPND